MRYSRRIQDNKRRKLYKKTEIFQKVLKYLYVLKTELVFKTLLKRKINLFYKINLFKSRIKNYCVITTRSRGIVTNYKVSRIIFRELGSGGYFSGLKKASW